MDTNEKIKKIIKENKVCLFMKGTPDTPQCGFSMTVTNILKHLNIEFRGINVLMTKILDKVLKILVIGQQYLNYTLKRSLLEDVI